MPVFPSWSDVHRIERKVDLALAKLGILISNQSISIQQEKTIMADLAAIKAKEDAALAAILANTDRLDSIKTALDAKDATIATLTQELKDAIANGADPAVLQEIADKADAIVAAANNQATAEAALTNTAPVPGTPPIVPTPPVEPPAPTSPTILSISPTSGGELGGTTVIITGADFIAADGVEFGGVAAASVTIDNPSQITAVTPPGTGTVDVNVIGSTGNASDPKSFTYVPPTDV